MGFPYDHGSQAFRRSLDTFVRVTTAAQATRRDGSTALSLCNVACGRYDGFIVEANSLWDYAAGVLLVREAGVRVADFAGRDDVASGASSQVVASNSALRGSLLACVNPGDAFACVRLPPRSAAFTIPVRAQLPPVLLRTGKYLGTLFM